MSLTPGGTQDSSAITGNTQVFFRVTIDSQAPTVTSVAPTDGASGVAIGTNVDATFSEDMDTTTTDGDPSMIDGSTFTLTKPDGPDADTNPDPVTGVVTYDSATKKATLNPDNDLDYSTTYTATVTTEAQDVVGNALDQDSGAAGNQPKTWTFTTAAPPCTPVSVTTQPEDKTITYGENATFTAAANGSPAPSVQWEKSTDGGNNWNPTGVTSSTLTLTKPPVSDSGSKYRAVFNNNCGPSGSTATSNEATLTVNAKQITITPDPGQSKVYGQADPVLTYTHSPALESGDSFTGALGRAPGNNVGLYAINLGTLSAGSNYNLNLSATTVNFEITKKGLTISGLTAQNKVYDGNTNATITGTPSLVGVVGTDDVTLAGTATGTFVPDASVGTGKTVTVSGLSLAGGAKDNYTLTLPTLSADITSWNAQGYGFYAPVGTTHSTFVAAPGTPPANNNAMDLWNTVKGGSTVPLKVNIYAGSVEKTSLSDIKGLTAQQLKTCSTDQTAVNDPVDFTTTETTSLRYDTTAKQWIQNWKTPKVGSETCYRATVTFADGSSISAFFKLLK